MVSLCLLSPASDYGMKLPILRSNPEDQILYQTERYNEETFGYEVPIKEEGDYVLVLKFAEVYFAQSQQKVRPGQPPCPPPSPRGTLPLLDSLLLWASQKGRTDELWRKSWVPFAPKSWCPIAHKAALAMGLVTESNTRILALGYRLIQLRPSLQVIAPSLLSAPSWFQPCSFPVPSCESPPLHVELGACILCFLRPV